MIKIDLDIQKYCSECPNFSPEVDCYKDFGDEKAVDHVVTIACKYKGHCKHLSKYHEKHPVVKQVVYYLRFYDDFEEEEVDDELWDDTLDDFED